MIYYDQFNNRYIYIPPVYAQPVYAPPPEPVISMDYGCLTEPTQPFFTVPGRLKTAMKFADIAQKHDRPIGLVAKGLLLLIGHDSPDLPDLVADMLTPPYPSLFPPRKKKGKKRRFNY